MQLVTCIEFLKELLDFLYLGQEHFEGLYLGNPCLSCQHYYDSEKFITNLYCLYLLDGTLILQVESFGGSSYIQSRAAEERKKKMKLLVVLVSRDDFFCFAPFMFGWLGIRRCLMALLQPPQKLVEIGNNSNMREKMRAISFYFLLF